MNAQTKDLLPCPFCGKPEPGHYEHPAECGVVRYVVCNTCGATCGDPDTLPEKTAYEAWNTRASATSAPKHGWISVADSLPKPFDEVWVYPRPDEYCCEALVNTNGEWTYSEYEINFGLQHIKCNVTHWMPKPHPPGATPQPAEGA